MSVYTVEVRVGDRHPQHEVEADFAGEAVGKVLDNEYWCLEPVCGESNYEGWDELVIRVSPPHDTKEE